MFVQPLATAEPFECAGISFRMVLPRNHTRSVEIVWERLEPGVSTPFDKHANFDQVFLVLKGAGEVTIGAETETIAAMDTVFVPKGSVHSVRCTSDDGLEYIFINVWPGVIPNTEADWRRVYSQINDRRVAESSVVRHK